MACQTMSRFPPFILSQSQELRERTKYMCCADYQIFVDEIDSLFKERSSGDHEVTGMMKAEFMTCVISEFQVPTCSVTNKRM